MPLQSDDPSLVTEEILRENLVVVSPAHDRVRKPYLRIEDLRGRPLVMFRRGYDLREATLAACRQAGFEPRFAVEGGEMDAVLRFVEAGLGVAVVPSMVLDGRPGLAGTPLAPPGLTPDDRAGAPQGRGADPRGAGVPRDSARLRPRSRPGRHPSARGGTHRRMSPTTPHFPKRRV